MKIVFLISLMAFTGLSPTPQQAGKELLDDAEAIMLSSCLQDRGRSISQCTCYVKGIKQQMAVTDHHFFMEALYYSSNRDKESFDKVMEKYGKKLEDLDTMSKAVALIGSKIEAACSPAGSIVLPKPQKK